jgi:chloramphenicol 3-O-phosphotransferase
MKFGFKHYFAPTPKRLRVLGDSLAAAGTFGASIVILNGHPVAGTIIMAVAVLGKFISNFFAEETIEVKPSKKKK